MSMMLGYAKNVLAPLFIGILLALSFGMLLIGMNMNMDMRGHMSHTDCPFMIGEQAICQMDVLDHLTAWQSMFNVLVPTLLILFSVVFVLTFLKIFSPPDTGQIRYVQRPKFVYRSLFKQLFIGSVLSPRAP